MGALPLRSLIGLNFAELIIRNGPNTVSESAGSNTELSEFFGPHRVPRREFIELLSSYHVDAKAN